MTTNLQTNSNTNAIKKASATETSDVVTVEQIISQIQSVCTLPDELIKAVLAVSISVKLKLPSSLWLMVIGVPSSAKTDLVNFLRKIGFVYFVDTLTQNPFASGYVAPEGKKSYDMLPEVNNKCFIVKDYTTIFSLSSETVKKLLGELVSIYDGQFKKFSPTRGLQEYKTNFSHIGCITPSALNKHTNYMNIIGPRFLFYRIPKLDEEKSKKGFEIAWQDDRKQRLSKIEKQVAGFLSTVTKKLEEDNVEIDFANEDIKKSLEELATFTSKSRGIVITHEQSFKDDEDKNVTYTEVIDWQIEEPWRAFQQLKGLAIALSIINQTYKISEDEINILEKIVLSSMPVQRAEVLECFKKQDALTARELSQLTKKSTRTCQRLLKELEFLGILKATVSTGTIAKEYTVEEQFINFFQGTHPKSVSRLVQESAEIHTEQLRILLAKDLKNISSDELSLYAQEAERWLTENINAPRTGEYELIDNVYGRLKDELQKREKVTDKTNASAESLQKSLIDE